MAEYGAWNSPSGKGGGYYYARKFLEQGYSICWLIGPSSPLHLLRFNKVSDPWERISSWIRNGKSYVGGPFAYCPLTLFPYKNYPLLRNKWVAQNTLNFTLPSLFSILKKEDFTRVDILWISNLSFYTLLDTIDYKVSIFRLSDDFSSFVHIPQNASQIEEELIKKVDIVFATAKSLVQKASKIKKNNVFYLPNGAQYSHFKYSQADQPGEYKNIHSPKVVYVGALNYWLDMELLDFACNNLENYTFVFIGLPKINVSKLAKHKNVLLLGSKEYKDIPVYLKYADVGIIPFKKNKLTDSVNPLKLYEYLGCGLPVVSTDLNETRNMEAPCYIAGSSREFVNLIQQAYEDGKNKKEFFEFARKNSWAERFKTIMEALESRA